MYQADQDPRNNLRSTSVNQMRLSNSSNSSIKQKKYTCENTNCPLRGYEFHWCSSSSCPLTNHCHLNGDQCEIIEPGCLAEKDPVRFPQQFVPQKHHPQYQQQQQQQMQLQHQHQQQRVNTPPNMQAQVVPSNQFVQQQFARNPTPVLNRQSQVFNYDSNNINPAQIMQSQNFSPKSQFAAQQIYAQAHQDYQNIQQRGLPSNHTYQDDSYSQFNNDCVPIPIVVLKRVYDDRNMRPVEHYSSVENLNQHQVSGFHPDEITENYSNAPPSTTLRSSSTLNIDCEDQITTQPQDQQQGLIRHSPTFDCLINNIIQKYYSEINKRSIANPATSSTSNLADPQLSQQERDQTVLRLSNKSELMNLNISSGDHLSRSSTHSLSNLQQQQQPSRSSSMPLSRVDKSRNVSFSNLNEASSQYDQSNPNIYTVPQEPMNSSTSGSNSSSTAQRLKDPSQVGFERQSSAGGDQFRSETNYMPKYEESEYKKKFDERSNNDDNQDFKRSTYTTQYSSDKRVPDYINSDNYDLPKFKEFKEYTYKEVTKLVKEYTPSRSKPAPPRYVQQSIKNSPYVQDLNDSTESLGQLGLERPETLTNNINNINSNSSNILNNTRSKSSSMISKSESKDNLKQLGFENLTDRLKQKSQVTFDLNESVNTPISTEAVSLNTTTSNQLVQDPATKSQIFNTTLDQNIDSQLKSQSQSQIMQQPTPQQIQQILSSSNLLVQSQQNQHQSQLNLLQQQQQQQQLQSALDAATAAIMKSGISPSNQTNNKEDKFDLNARIELLINEQKKSNEILQTAIKSLCQAYYSSNGGGCQGSN